MMRYFLQNKDLTRCETALYPLCHAPSIDEVDGQKSADCLSPTVALAKVGRISALSGRFGDAQGSPVGAAGHGRLLLVRFLARARK
jgi:hypothetical protein